VVAIAKKKKKSSPLFLLIVFLGCVAIAAATVVALALRPPDSNEAIAEHGAINLYELLAQVRTINLDDNFPDTPEAVMRLYNNTFRLLYGWDRSDTYTISQILRFQRGLYSQALYDLNPFQQQLSNLLFARGVEYDMGIELVGLHQGPPVFNRFSPDRCTVYVIKFISNGQSFHYSYQLFQHPETGRWEIAMWDEL